MGVGKGDPALGAWIKEVRKRQGLRQADVARAMGIQQPSVNRIEKGTQGVSAKQLMAVEQLLGATYGAVQPDQVFERGFAAGEFSAIAGMATAIAARASAAERRLREGGATPVTRGEADEALDDPPAREAPAPRRRRRG